LQRLGVRSFAGKREQHGGEENRAERDSLPGYFRESAGRENGPRGVVVQVTA